MNKQDFLNANKPKIVETEIEGQKIFLRELTVGDHNVISFGQHKIRIEIAKKQGIELSDDPDELELQLNDIVDPYSFARGLARRICDESGKLIFDPNNYEDLEALNSIKKDTLIELGKVASEKKL